MRKNVLKYDDVMNIAAPGDLRAAAPRARGRGHVRGDPRLDRRGHRAHVATLHGGRVREEWDLDALARRCTTCTAPTSRRTSCARRSTLEPRGAHRGVPGGRARRVRRQGAGARRELMRDLERYVTSRSSTRAGASTSRTWTTSARACTCARSRRRTRSSSTAARATRCSRSSALQIREEVVATLFHAQLAPEDAPRLEQQPVAGDGDALVRARDAAGRGRDRGRRRAGGAAARRSRPPARRRARADRLDHAGCCRTRTRSSAATTRAGAARARSTRSATALTDEVRRGWPRDDDVVGSRLEPRRAREGAGARARRLSRGARCPKSRNSPGAAARGDRDPARLGP